MEQRLSDDAMFEAGIQATAHCGREMRKRDALLVRDWNRCYLLLYAIAMKRFNQLAVLEGKEV